eukprot:1145008-Pelagomonas_calceolata.AAC.2
MGGKRGEGGVAETGGMGGRLRSLCSACRLGNRAPKGAFTAVHAVGSRLVVGRLQFAAYRAIGRCLMGGWARLQFVAQGSLCCGAVWRPGVWCGGAWSCR